MTIPDGRQAGASDRVSGAAGRIGGFPQPVNPAELSFSKSTGSHQLIRMVSLHPLRDPISALSPDFNNPITFIILNI